MDYYQPSPYEGLTFWSFLLTFATRLLEMVSGKLSMSSWATDELQIATLAAVSLSGACVGIFLILRRITMLANALSHTILVGVVIAYLLTHTPLFGSGGGDLPLDPFAFLIAAVITGITTTFLTEFMTRTLKLSPDSSTGLTFTALFALGILLVTLLTRSVHISAEVVIGNVDALQLADVKMASSIALFNVILLLLFYKEYVVTTFDTVLAATMGIPVLFYHYLLMVQVSVTAVSGFRAVGVLMVLAMLTAPAMTARLFCSRLPSLLIVATIIGITASVGGVAIARHLLTVYSLPLSTAGVTVILLSAIFASAALIRSLIPPYSYSYS